MSSGNYVECPQCKRQTCKQNRLITETCGHSKCRQCFLADEIDCLQCKSIKAVTGEVTDGEIEIQQKKIAAVCSASPAHIQQHFTVDGFVDYHCTVCNKHFNRTEQYYHFACVSEERKKYSCKVCQKKFSSRSHLNYHNESHESNSYKCSECGKTFEKLTILRKHEKHHKKPPVKCSICNKEFRHKESLEAHVAKHKNELNFACEFCAQRFANKSALQQHMLKHSEKKHQCNQCGHRFQRNSSLTSHMRRHSETESHACTICNKIFKDSNALLRHSDTHIGTMKYKCTECDLKSLRKDTIMRHARIIHIHKNPKSCVEKLPPVASPPDTDLTNLEILEEQFSELSCEDILMESCSPKTVENSSVIKCVGNVEPFVIPGCSKTAPPNDEIIHGNQAEYRAELTTLTNVHINTFEPTVHKKLRKKYDPIEMYRKILNSADEAIQDEVVNTAFSPEMEPPIIKPTIQRHRSQSNFSETHWRKNFKYTYQSQDY